MGSKTEISWINSTFNPWWGCVKVSPSCDNCYADTFATRVGYGPNPVNPDKFPIWGKNSNRKFFDQKHWDGPKKWDKKAAKGGARIRVFCGSMCDVMEDSPNSKIPVERLRLFELIEATPNIDWQLLTKRPQNYRRFLPESWLDNPLPNVWLGTTCESPAYHWRIEELRKTPATKRFLSIEPLLEDIGQMNLIGISWCIIGGESGPCARPFDVEWVRSAIRQCREAGVKCFVKQLGTKPMDRSNINMDVKFPENFDRISEAEQNKFFNMQARTAYISACELLPVKLKNRKGADMSEWPEDLRVREML